jgi:hypothetical protein
VLAFVTATGKTGQKQKGFKTEVLKPLVPEPNAGLGQKFCNGIAAVDRVCRA